MWVCGSPGSRVGSAPNTDAGILNIITCLAKMLSWLFTDQVLWVFMISSIDDITVFLALDHPGIFVSMRL